MRAARSWLRWLARILSLSLVFAVAVGLGILLHVGLSPARRLAAAAITRVLDGPVRGTIVIEHIDRLSVDGVGGVTAVVYDEEGRRVLAVYGLRARSSLLDLVRTLVRGPEAGKMEISVARARAEHVEVMLSTDASGEIGLARAFWPRPRPAGSSGPATEVEVWLPDIEIGTAEVTGFLEPVQQFTVELGKIGGSVLVGTERTSIRVKRYSVRARGVWPALLEGTARTLIEMPSSTGEKLSLWGTFDGYLGAVQIGARGDLDGDALNVVVNVPAARQEAVQPLVPAFPLRSDSSLHLEARGRLPELTVTGGGSLGDSAVYVAGRIRTPPDPSALLDLDVHALDLRSFALSAPQTSITGRAHVEAYPAKAGGVEGSASLHLEPFRIGEVDIPALAADIKLDPSGVAGRATSDRGSLRSSLDFRLRTSAVGSPLAIDWEWAARAPDIARVPWLSALGSGQARWQARGHIADGRLEASGQGELSDWSRQGFALRGATWTATLRGPFAGLLLSSTAHGEGLVAAGLYWDEIDATVEGPLTRLAIDARAHGDEDLEVAARAVLERGTRVSGVELSARRGETTVALHAGVVEDVGQGVALRDLELLGAGAPVRGSLFLGPDEWRVALASAELDLGKVAKLIHPAAEVRGLLTFDIDAAFGRGGDRAHARIELREAALAGVSGISANGEAAIDGRRFSGGLNVQLGELGGFTAASPSALLAGAPGQRSSWTDATGTLELRGQVDLARLVGLPAARLTTLGDVGGTIWVRAGLARADLEAPRGHAPPPGAAPPPDLDLLVWSDGLAADLHEVAGPGARVEGIDGQIGLHVEGESGRANLTVRTVDAEGVFVALTALAELPWAAVWNRPSEAWSALEPVPITAHLTMPRRSLGKYPAMLRPGSLSGDVEVSADWSGPLRTPTLLGHLRGHGIQPTGEALALPVDVQADLTYDGSEAVARLQARRPEGEAVLEGNVNIKAPIAAWLDGKNRPRGPWWQASGGARLLQFPLAGLPMLAERGVSGLASGSLAFSGLGKDPDISVELNLANVKIERAAFPRGLLSARVSRGGLLISGKLDQTQGGASASATARVQWSSALAPALDWKAPLDLYVEARDLRAGALRPLFFRDIFAIFDARLNGTLHLHKEGQDRSDKDMAEGFIDLREARFQIPEIGQEFQNGKATLAVGQNGEVEVSDVSADAASGRLTASGRIALQGLRFVRGEGTLAIGKNQAIPLTLEGLSIGEAWGTLQFRVAMEGANTVNIDVDVPLFRAEMPESSSRDLQGLGDNPKIKVGMRKDDGTLVPLLLGPLEAARSEDALRWHLVFKLGKEVSLRRGAPLELTFAGQPVVDITDRAHVSGTVELRSGKVEVFGKRFELEHGAARFGEDAGNPDVQVSARWDAPDGTRIYANFIGPLRTGVLTLRSEPQRAQDEILSILLTGSSESDTGPSSLAQQHASGAQTAGYVLAGGAVSTSLNRVLSSVTPLDITTRVTTDEQGPTPEVAVQITPGVTAGVSYRTRAPGPGEKPDIVFVTLDWRFRRNWSVVTTFGDQGSSVLDLIWQYRY